jgi:HEPN domain-containing protein
MLQTGLAKRLNRPMPVERRVPRPFRLTNAEKPLFDALLTQVCAHPDKLDAIRGALGDEQRLLGGGHIGGRTFVSPEAALGVVRDLLRVQLKPLLMYLVGSHARGTADAVSDFDIVLVFDDVVAQQITTEDVWRPLHGLSLPVDLVALSKAEFERDRHTAGSFAHQAANEGRLLWRRWTKEEADSFANNCNAKLFIKPEGCSKTTTLADQARITKMPDLPAQNGCVNLIDSDRMDAPFQHRNRIEFLDLKGQPKGFATHMAANQHVFSLLTLALEDLAGAEQLQGGLDRLAAYHVSQCVEKLARALVEYRTGKRSATRLHQIATIASELPMDDPLRDRFVDLDATYSRASTAMRYPHESTSIVNPPPATLGQDIEIVRELAREIISELAPGLLALPPKP